MKSPRLTFPKFRCFTIIFINCYDFFKCLESVPNTSNFILNPIALHGASDHARNSSLTSDEKILQIIFKIYTLSDILKKVRTLDKEFIK